MARSYTLFWTITGEPPGGVRVTAEIPSDWTETLDGTGAPTFEVPGTGSALISIVAIHADGATDAARLEWAMSKQFGANTAAAQRSPRSGGRLWAMHGKHGRMFLPAPHDSVVMATAMAFGGDASWMAKVEKVFDTLRVS